MRIYKLPLVILFLLLFNLTTSAVGKLEIKGKTECLGTPLQRVKIQVLSTTGEEQNLRSGEDGSFFFHLDLNAEYEVVFELQGFRKEHYSVNTNVPAARAEKYYSLPNNVGMLPYLGNIPMTEPEGPEYIISYLEPSDKFLRIDSSPALMKRKTSESMIHQRLKQYQSKYSSEIRSGDEQYGKANYGDALKSFQNARGVYPEEIRGYFVDLAELDSKITDCSQAAASSTGNDEDYKLAIRTADDFLKSRDYDNAIKVYQQASAFKPDEKYPIDQIAKARSLKSEYEANKVMYDVMISSADKWEKQKHYTKARSDYEQASLFLPDEPLPKQKIEALDKLIPERDAIYSQAMKDAEKLLTGKNYDEALAAFRNAKRINPEAEEPSKKIDDVTAMLAGTYKKDGYDDAITRADRLFGEASYQQSLTAYEDALRIRPAENYPKTRIADIKALLSDRETLQKNYARLIADAEKKFAANDYAGARDSYIQASGLKPEEVYPLKKIEEIDALLAAQDAMDAKYKEAIRQADLAFNTADYTGARSHYEEAAVTKPSEKYPAGRIREIDAILAKQKADAEGYRTSIASADAAFAREAYDEARKIYQTALSYKPGDTYAAGQVEKINGLLREADALNASYLLAINEGDSKFKSESYQEALTAYQKASDLKPAEAYPRERIQQINTRLEEIAREEAAYREIIANADVFFNSEDYESARTRYMRALELRSREQYPKDQISKIDGILARMAGERKAFDDAIAAGDNAFRNKQYSRARDEYQKALQLRPEEGHPAARIKEIAGILEAMKANREQYDRLISTADRLYTENNLEGALADYRKALDLMPEEKHPAGRITEIENTLQERKQLEAAYFTAIAEGDGLFGTGKYRESIDYYRKASELKPQEEYPRNRLTEAQKIIDEQNARQQAYEQAIAAADQLYTEQKLEDAKSKYEEARDLKPEAPYPPERISRINQMLADIRGKQQLYDEYISKADGFYSEKSWYKARDFYEQAGQVMSQEDYPKKRLSEVNAIIAEEERKAQERYNSVIAEADKAWETRVLDKAMEKYKEAGNIKPSENYPKDMVRRIMTYLEEHAILDIASNDVEVLQKNEKKFSFTPMEIRKRKNNYILMRAKNGSGQSFKVFINYGKDSSKNGGVVIKTVEGEELTDYIINIGSQYRWYDIDNNWISIYPEGGDLQVSLIQITSGE